jgi:Fis family transcriptional regulator
MRHELDNAITLMQAGGVTYEDALHAFKRLYIVKLLNRNRGSQTKTAREMGVHRNTIRRMMADLNISLREDKESEAA